MALDSRLMNRTNVPTWLRLAVLERDQEQCRYCGDRHGPFHMDHVRPASWGGETTLDNLVTACAPCNLRKGANAWTPQPIPTIDRQDVLDRAARRLTLERIAVGLGHSPHWIPVGRKAARWWCDCEGDRMARRPLLPDRADLPFVIRGHLMDAIGVSYFPNDDGTAIPL